MSTYTVTATNAFTDQRETVAGCGYQFACDVFGGLDIDPGDRAIVGTIWEAEVNGDLVVVEKDPDWVQPL